MQQLHQPADPRNNKFFMFKYVFVCLSVNAIYNAATIINRPICPVNAFVSHQLTIGNALANLTSPFIARHLSDCVWRRSRWSFGDNVSRWWFFWLSRHMQIPGSSIWDTPIKLRNNICLYLYIRYSIVYIYIYA